MQEVRFERRTYCPVCSSKKLTSVYSSEFTENGVRKYLLMAYGQAKSFDIQHLKNAKYSLLKCEDCDLIFQEYIPSPKFMSQLYGNWTSDIIKSPQQYRLSYYSIYSQDILQILAYLGKPPANLKVLDFGMGWGRWALMAKAFGCEVYGVDLSDRCVEYAKANGINTIRWHDIPNYKFDFINTDQVFEHLAEPVSILTQLERSLQTDGVIKICVPNSFGMRYRLGHMDWSAPKGSVKSLNPVAPLEHINCFYRKSMLRLAQQVELSEVKIPIAVQYQYTAVWNSPKRALRNIVMPIYRNLLGLQNYYLFKKSAV